MRHLFVVNPAAGGRKSRHEETIARIHEAMRGLDDTYEVYITKAPMDAADKIRAESESCEPLRVYACGGDGTLNECANGAANLPHVAVTHYPTGTGNDFVKMFGPTDAQAFTNIGRLLNGTVHPVDLIDVGGRYSLNICSVGIDARIGTDVHKYSALPLVGGATAYVVSMIVNLARGVNQPLKVTLGDMVFDEKPALICACNGRFYGGGFNPVPEAMPDDGVIDFLLAHEISRMRFLLMVGKYAKGRYRELTRIITHLRGNDMTVESPTELAVNVDGELLHAKTVRFRLHAHALNFICPSGVHFFDKQSTAAASV